MATAIAALLPLGPIISVSGLLIGAGCAANGGAGGGGAGGMVTSGGGAAGRDTEPPAGFRGTDAAGSLGSGGVVGAPPASSAGVGGGRGGAGPRADGAGTDGSGGEDGGESGGESGHGNAEGGAGAVAGASAGGSGTGGSGGGGVSSVSLTLFDQGVFYDGYASVVAEPVPDGVQRLRNDLLTRKLSDDELNAIQNTLRVQVVVGALCDNYDRIGSVALALVPKGQSSYAADSVDRIEVGRYITPFMNRNKKPDEVRYTFVADNLVPVLHDDRIRARFDLWLELELFGVPYAANEEVAGCANRNDVFRGSLTLDSDSSVPAQTFDALLPIAYKENFNDYQSGASDRLGETRKTVEFVLDSDAANAQLVLITSNHGANSGGEEYSRRDHFVYFDDERVLSYKPGRKSCEPFRASNTQPNGIYGSAPRSDAMWQSFSNWCPGDVIDTRIVTLGPRSAGRHKFVIDVPAAQFVGDEGNFPLSLYLQWQTN